MKLSTFKLFGALFIASLIGCVSAESPTLSECRRIQDDIQSRIAEADTLLNRHAAELRLERDALSVDTLLAIDSTLRLRYSSIKQAVGEIEFTQSELHAWHDKLIVLPPAQEVARGIQNPFGESAGDEGILQILNQYNDSLQNYELRISELIRNTSYERTPAPQPQEQYNP
jgi:hypothetical protein